MRRVIGVGLVVAAMMGIAWIQHAFAGAWLYDSSSDAPIAGADVVVLAENSKVWHLRTNADGRIPFPRELSRGRRWKMLICAPDRRPVTYEGSSALRTSFGVQRGSPGYFTLRERGWEGPIPRSCVSPDLAVRFKSLLEPICKQSPVGGGGIATLVARKRRSI